DIQSMINAIEKKAPQLSQVMVALKDISPNPYQPRKHFHESKLNEWINVLGSFYFGFKWLTGQFSVSWRFRVSFKD
ncbi:MAG: hypothetical protein K2M02_01320, partial [Duncaniella sp.]|nr:hypothetical protein [Duncaniella sp.]